MGLDSTVGIVIRYGLVGPGTEFRWGARFSATVQTSPGVQPASYAMGTGSFPAVKWLGCTVLVGPCHHGMARPQVADRGTASDKEGNCEKIE